MHLHFHHMLRYKIILLLNFTLLWQMLSAALFTKFFSQKVLLGLFLERKPVEQTFDGVLPSKFRSNL